MLETVQARNSLKACIVQTAGLETLQEDLQVPNHRVPLGAAGVQEALKAGQTIRQLLEPSVSNTQQQQDSQAVASSSSSSDQQSGKLFMYTSPFLRCIQTAQHISRALHDDQVRRLASEGGCVWLLGDVQQQCSSWLVGVWQGGGLQRGMLPECILSCLPVFVIPAETLNL